MKVTLTSNYKWKAINFCCPEMGEQVMAHNIQPSIFSDHIPRFLFQIGDYMSYINYCPYCGTKIEGEFEVDKDD